MWSLRRLSYFSMRGCGGDASYLTVTVSFFVELAAPFVALAVKVTFEVPTFFAVMFVIEVPGASG